MSREQMFNVLHMCVTARPHPPIRVSFKPPVQSHRMTHVHSCVLPTIHSSVTVLFINKRSAFILPLNMKGIYSSAPIQFLCELRHFSKDFTHMRPRVQCFTSVIHGGRGTGLDPGGGLGTGADAPVCVRQPVSLWCKALLLWPRCRK